MSNNKYLWSKEARCLDAGLDIDSALDAFYRSKWKEKVNKILLIEEPDREAEEPLKETI